jgi:hypothetical protein
MRGWIGAGFLQLRIAHATDRLMSTAVSRTAFAFFFSFS